MNKLYPSCPYEFKPVSLNDKDTLLPYLQCVPLPICDYAFTNLYGWSHYYNTQWAIMGDNTLVIRFIRNNAHYPLYMLPHCSMSESRIKAIVQLKEFSLSKGYPLFFFGVTPPCSNNLEETFPNEFNFVWKDRSVDYIYTREKLARLAGKKLQAKRNHINKFKKLYPNYIYEPLQKKDIASYLAFVDKWLDGEVEPNESLIAENKMIHRILEAYEPLQLFGGVIRVDNAIIALTIASYINDTVVDVHVEKADVNYEGAYAIINNEFAKSLPETVLYLNREEDLGIPGLRKAKESYHPDKLLEKGVAILKSSKLSP